MGLLTEHQISYSAYRQKSRGALFRTRCTTTFGLCVVNEKRRLTQQHRLNLSEFKGNCKWIWVTWQCKFVGDASLNNDSFIHCVIFWILQLSITGQICSFLWTRKNKKKHSVSVGLRPLTSHRRLCPLDPRWGLCPHTPVIGSRSALAIEFELCAVLNWSLKKPWWNELTIDKRSK